MEKQFMLLCVKLGKLESVQFFKNHDELLKAMIQDFSKVSGVSENEVRKGVEKSGVYDGAGQCYLSQAKAWIVKGSNEIQWEIYCLVPKGDGLLELEMLSDSESLHSNPACEITYQRKYVQPQTVLIDESTLNEIVKKSAHQTGDWFNVYLEGASMTSGGSLVWHDLENNEKQYISKNELLNGIKLFAENVVDFDVFLNDGSVDIQEIDGDAVDVILQYAFFGRRLY